VTAYLLEGAARRYDWGSVTAIPRLLGRAPDGAPLAELWFGAHPHDSACVVERDIGLDALIAADPQLALGTAVRERFGAQLPYLVKLLAADTPLSLQVHPDRAQAEAGFAIEEAAGIPHDAPNRNYRDRNHKPELLCALTPFEALCGFRPVSATVGLLDELDLPELAFLRAALAGPDPLRDAFARTLALADPTPVAIAVGARVAEDGPLRGVWLAARHFPGDVGVVLALLLNYVRLQPGQAIFLGAGTVHAYLDGTGVEIMAESDNVLRCGLTSKHVDAPELLRITDFSELPDPVWPAGAEGFTVPVPDFRLLPVQSDDTQDLRIPGPRIVLCTQGRLDVAGISVPPGQAAFVPAAAATFTVKGDGSGFIAAVGR
jgi:mannose-6-phosphate isomerase